MGVSRNKAATIAGIQNRAMYFNLLFSLTYNQTGIVATEQNHFSPDAKVVRIYRFGYRQAFKTPFLGEITNLWFNTSPFQ